MKISVVVPNYNSGRYLEKSLDSIFQQSYPDYEVVVVDGGSTDNSLEILDRYKRIHENLRVYSTDTEGAVAHINEGFALTKGDIVTWLAADDTYEPGCFQAVYDQFQHYQPTQWVYGRSKIIDDEDKESRRIVTKIKELLQPRYSYNALCCISFIPCPSVFLRKEFRERVGKYDNNWPLIADYNYWLRAGKLSRPVFLDRYMANWRAHEGSLSTSNYRKQMIDVFNLQKRYSGSVLRPAQAIICLLSLMLYGTMATTKKGEK